MVILKTNEAKKLKFGVSVSGIETRDLAGAVRIILDDIEIGIRTSVEDNNLVATIPPLQDVLNMELTEGQKINAKLEVVAGDTFSVPWTDRIVLETPIKVEAVIAEEEDIKTEEKKSVAVTVVDEEDIKTETKKVIKEKKKSKPKSKFAAKLLEN
jgi:hypothetical protein